MKKIFLLLIIILFSLSLFGCNLTQENQTQKKLIKSGNEGFIEPEPSDWVKYIKPVREYLYYRTQAVLQGDINILWEQFPKLKTNSDKNKGINIEKNEVDLLSGELKLTLLDANFNEEGYERIKVKTINENEVVVLVHGSIIYLMEDFDISGGEILIELYLQQKNNHWTIVKTDEYILHEYKEWIKSR